MRNRIGYLSTGILLLIFAQPLWAQQQSTDELKNEVETLKQKVTSMQKDLQDIKLLLQARTRVAPVQNVTLDLANRPSRGANTAALTLIEFSDYQCPFCGQYARETIPQLDKEYIQTGKIKYVVMDLPLESMHKMAFKAAEAAGCAEEQGKFWEMYNRLFTNQQILDQWKNHAEAIGLDVDRFTQCMDSGKRAVQIRTDMAEAQKAGINGTPAFFLAYTDTNSTTIKTVAKLAGAQPYASFKAAIDKLLSDKPEGGKE
jgi:protein-disulfide isomerase